MLGIIDDGMLLLGHTVGSFVSPDLLGIALLGDTEGI